MFYKKLKELFTLKMKNPPLSTHPHVDGSVFVHKMFMELHSKTALQCSVKQLKKLETKKNKTKQKNGRIQPVQRNPSLWKTHIFLKTLF